jgi:hypothetical protein
VFHLSKLGVQGRYLKVYISDTPFNDDLSPHEGQLVAPIILDERDMEGRPWREIATIAILQVHVAALSLADKRDNG